MDDSRPWTAAYLEEKYSNPDPWRYFTSPFEQKKYHRQLQAIEDRNPLPGRILEIGSAEGAHTLLLAQHFPKARITAVEISSQAAQRARENLASFSDRVELVNDDLLDYESSIEGSSVDVCIWSESVYYLGARLSLHGIFDLLKRVIGKLRPGGLLIMANAVNLPEEVPESAITSRPVIDCYYQLLSALAEPIEKAIYEDKKAGRIYEYQIWVFRKG